MSIKIRFYKAESGTEPVREWLLSLSKADRVTIGYDAHMVQEGWPLGKPLVDSLGLGLWEIRSKLSSKIARIIFYIESGEIILLHGFIKKTQKTPDHELEVARTRMKQCQKKSK